MMRRVGNRTFRPFRPLYSISNVNKSIRLYSITPLQVTGQTSSWILYSSVVPTLLQRQRTDWKSSKKIHSHDSRPQGSLYEQRLAKTKLWSLENRRTRADLIEVYKIIHGLSAVRFSTFSELSHNERTRGHSEVTQKKLLWRISDNISFRTGSLTSGIH